MGSDIADRFRRGEYFRTIRNGKPAYGYVYEYNRGIIVTSDSNRGFKIERDDVPEDAIHLYVRDIVALPLEVSLIFKAAALVAGN